MIALACCYDTAPSGWRTTTAAQRRQRVRVEVRSVDTLRETLPYLPQQVAAPLTRLVAHLAQIHQAHQAAPAQPIDRCIYDRAYDAWYEARQRVLERFTWLREYGYAVLVALPPSIPAAKELTDLLRRPMHASDRSLANLVMAQSALDAVLARCEQLL